MFEEIKKMKIVKDTILKEYNHSLKLINEKENNLLSLSQEIVDYDKSYEILENIINKINENHIKKIEKMLNKAISSIFYDERYELKIKTENKKLSFYLIDNNKIDKDNIPMQVNMEDACGGGIITVVSFILQLFIIELLSLNKVIFIDEGFMALSEKYRPLFYDFINDFCKSTDMAILLVSHDELVKEKAVQEIEIELYNGKKRG